MQRVWNYEYYGDMRTVDVTVRRLREKMGRLDDDVMKQVDTAIAVSFGLHPETMV